MFTLTDRENFIDVKIEGKLTSDEIEDIKNYFKQKEKEQDAFNVAITVEEIGYSFEGFIEDIKFEAGHLDRFKKVAIISDKKWMEILGKLVNHIPDIQLETFNFNERKSAVEWLSH